MTFKDHVKRTYGTDSVTLVSRYSKCAEGIARHRNNIIFDLRCKKAGLLPPSLRIRSPISTGRGIRIATRASQQFLNEHIRYGNQQKKALTDEMRWIELELRRRMNEEDFNTITTMAQSTAEATFRRRKEHQQTKFEKLRNRSQPKEVNTKEPSTWVVNLSSHQLTQAEQKVLAKGLNFAPAPKRIPTQELIAGAEQALRYHPDNLTAERARAAIANVIRRGKPPKSNVTKEERQALRDLEMNEEILISNADKGNAVVVMNIADYDSKAHQLLSTAPFQKLKKDPTSKNEKTVNDALQVLFKKGRINKEVYNRLKVSLGNTRTALFYGLPKIHKSEVPLRPIVSSVGSATYALSKYISDIIKPLTGNTESAIRNTVDFCEEMKSIEIEKDEILISFDVKSLYTSIPTDETLSIVEMKLLDDDTLINRTSLSPKEIKQLLSLCLKTTNFRFRNSFYQLTDGVAMGSPASAPVANIFMEHFEQKAIATLHHRPKVWKRFVDDVLAVIKRRDRQTILNQLNNQHPNITFTYEEESNNQLPFMDVRIRRNNEGFLSFEVYRKSTHTGKYLSFNSHHPTSAKRSVVHSLLGRAERITSNDIARKAEIEEVYSQLQLNGYPLKFIKNTHRRTKAICSRKPTPPSNDSAISGIASIPFVDGISQTIARILSKLEIRTIQRPMQWKWTLQRKLKDKLPAIDKPGVVYQLNCQDCDKAYIGETKRTARSRAKEHASSARNGHPEISAAAEHSISTSHQMDWNNPQILNTEQNLLRRRVKEALAIHTHKKLLNRDTGLELSKLWLDLA